MKTSSPKQLALFSATLISVLFVIITTVLEKIYDSFFWLGLFIGIIVLFSFVYFFINQILKNLLFKKINPIYKTILNYDIEKKELKGKLKKENVVEEVNREVISWAQNKTKEIDNLKQLEKYRKDFLGNVSHELKTPIFNIQGYILTLLDGAIDDPEINKHYLERTEKSINRIISIVEDLGSISRLESGELKLTFEYFDLIELVKEVFEQQELAAKKRKIKLKLHLNEVNSIMVYADRKRILEVVNNLVNNSINYGIKKGETTVSFIYMGENILTEISDNGIGISENDIPRLFEKFFRIDKSRSKERGGTGLGLSIVKYIIEAHKQTINVRSKLEKGSTFAFTLQKANEKVREII